MKKTIVLFLFFCAIFMMYSVPSVAERQYLYYGFHYESAGTVNSRVGFISDPLNTYWITDCIIPPYLIANAVGWNRDESSVGSQMKIFYTRLGGGILSYRLPRWGTMALDFSAEAVDVVTKIDPDTDELNRKHISRVVVPFGPGISHLFFYSSWLNVLTAVNVQPVLTREKGDLPWRVSAEMYFHFHFFHYMTAYASLQYAYFVKGLSGSVPNGKPFGGFNLCAGLAF